LFIGIEIQTSFFKHLKFLIDLLKKRFNLVTSSDKSCILGNKYLINEFRDKKNTTIHQVNDKGLSFRKRSWQSLKINIKATTFDISMNVRANYVNTLAKRT
jgi:hypothetical protein